MSLPTINRLIAIAQEWGASDLFLGEGAKARVKLHGSVHELDKEPSTTRAELEAFWRHCGADPARDTDRDSSYQPDDNSRLRVALFRQAGRIGAALRTIRNQVPTMDALGLPEDVLMPWIQRRSGLILITGATGSGKSTTVASCLEWLNANVARHIVTIEDPVEYQFSSKLSLINQREVGTDSESFGRALRAAMRMAPDVLFLGEIRDPESAAIALQACETGHLVITTLHSSDAVDTLERLISIFPERERDSCLLLLSMQLIGILSQMLLPTADGEGFALVPEYLENGGAVRNWIREEKLPEIRDYMNRQQTPGSVSFIRGLVSACQAGIISTEVASRAVHSEADFVRAMRGLS